MKKLMNLGGWGLHIIKVPSGKFAFVGSVPSCLVKDAPRSFETEEVAEQFFKNTFTGIVSDAFVPGAVMASSWGYEQTNVDFYCILERKGEWATLVPMKQDGMMEDLPGGSPSMTSKVSASVIDWEAKPIRKKIKSFNGKESGCRMQNGWASLWNGKPKYASHYA